MTISGFHHVTAIAGDAQQNLDFYTQSLGLHLVKRTVNYDDPGTHHLYYGDAQGSPGSLLTFFPWGSQRKGIGGTNVAQAVSLQGRDSSRPFEWETSPRQAARQDWRPALRGNQAPSA